MDTGYRNYFVEIFALKCGGSRHSIRVGKGQQTILDGF